ncbi:hypothetical protein ID866_5040 [Astraeus odoratus]|nr:hypothetical protein ID866_5040 [Astraeus odoratus]
MFKLWLLPNYSKFAAMSDAYDDAAILQTYSTVVELLSYTNCYGSLLEVFACSLGSAPIEYPCLQLSLSVLSQTSNAQMILTVGEVFHRFATVWTSMNCTGMITSALYSVHMAWKNRGMQVRSLSALLLQMDAGRYLEESARAQIIADMSSFAHALAPETVPPEHVPSVLPEILLLADDPKPDAPSILANGFWYKYRTALDWGWKVWDNTIASLRQVPAMTEDTNKRHSMALRYAQFLLHVDQHLPAGIDKHVLQWCLGNGKGEILALSAGAWDTSTFYAGTDVNAFLSGRISSELSPWRLAGTAVQLQFGLRQLGRAMAHDSTRQAASSSLDKMTSILFHHSMAPDEAYFIAEVARDIDGPVAEKFFNNGFKSIIEIFTRAPLPLSLDTLIDRVNRAGELLRVLSHVAEPLRMKPTNLPLDPLVQERLSKVILDTFIAIEVMLSGVSDTSRELTRSAIFLARLLQFNLGFTGLWSLSCIEIHESLSSILFRLSLIHADGTHFDPVAFSLLADTLYFVIDELNSHLKSTNPDPFKFYPKISEVDLPPGMPSEFYTQLCSLLSQLPPNDVVKDLVHAHRDSSGQLVYGSPVQNRPWEWIENLGESAVEDGLTRLPDSVIKNTGSLSLELFAARPTGDHILQPSGLTLCKQGPDQRNMRLEGDLRSFEDGLTSETIYRRDWREARLEIHRDAHARSPEGASGDATDDIKVSALASGQARSGSRRPSPASSVRSRDSAHGSITSMKQSPGIGTRTSLSTVSESMEEGDMSTAETEMRGHKRKAESESELEMVEGPVAGKSRKAKTIKSRPKRK